MSALFLDEAWQVLCATTHSCTRHDLDGLHQGFDLTCAHSLLSLIICSLLAAVLGQISKVLGISIKGGGGVSKVRFCFSTILLTGCFGFHLLGLNDILFLLELLAQLLDHVNDST